MQSGVKNISVRLVYERDEVNFLSHRLCRLMHLSHKWPNGNQHKGKTNLFEDVVLDDVSLDLVAALHAGGRRERPVTLDNAFETSNLK